MSQHPSLRSSDKGRQHRSVLKRYEKIKILKDKEKWKDEDSVFGLAKVKIVKFKVKKEKAAATAEGAEAIAPGAAPAAGTIKGAPAPKAAGAKETAKPANEGKKEAK